jgi:hypothetical protein
MREFSPIILKLSVLLAPAIAHAEAVKNNAQLNQREIQVLSRQVNDQGSDESLRNSAVYAMQALMDLSATRLPNAMTNGYRAYGKFRNSENLDRLKDINALNANSLASIESGAAELPVRTETSFRRLDPAFLYQGDAGKVAAEFERLSGMKRNDFLVHMAEASEKKIKRSDPQMIDKAFSRFEGFIDKIPNAEFRANLERNMNIVPETMRRGMVAQAVTKLAGFFADAGTAGAVSPLDSTISEKGVAQLAGTQAAPSDQAGERKPAAATEASALPPPPGKKGKDGGILGSVVLSAIRTQGQDAAPQASPSEMEGEQTIFQQVTKRYRILTPKISKLPGEA